MTEAEMLAHEEKKTKDAITVDFILSVEIVMLALGTVSKQPSKYKFLW